MNRVPPTRRLSMGTLFHKRVFPGMLFACAALAVVFGLWALRYDPAPGSAGFAVLFVTVAVAFHYFYNRHFTYDLADEVLDGGDFLRIRRGTEQEDVRVGDIERVSESLFTKQPPRIELVLTYPGKFGRVISFIPAGYSLVPFGLWTRSWVFDELSRRVESAQRDGSRAKP